MMGYDKGHFLQMLGVFKNPTGTGEIIGLKQSIILEACEVYLRTKGQDLMPKFIQLSGNKKKKRFNFTEGYMEEFN